MSEMCERCRVAEVTRQVLLGGSWWGLCEHHAVEQERAVASALLTPLEGAERRIVEDEYV